MALGAAEEVIKEHMAKYPKRELTTEDLVAIASDIAKSAQYKGVAELLPTRLLERKAAK